MKVTIYKENEITGIYYNVVSFKDYHEEEYITFKYMYGNSTIKEVYNYAEFSDIYLVKDDMSIKKYKGDYNDK